MKRHYRSRQHRLTLGQSVIAASERASELAEEDNSHKAVWVEREL